MKVTNIGVEMPITTAMVVSVDHPDEDVLAGLGVSWGMFACLA
jgi:hypothetical protein